MRRLSPVTIAAVTIALALVGSLATNTVHIEAPWWPWVLWAATGLLVMAAVAIEIGSHSGEPERPPGIDPGLDDVADQLARAVQAQWRREEAQRKVHDPLPLPVRWHPVADHLIDHWANIHRAPLGVNPAPLVVAAELEQIVEVYRRIPSGRLVILGKAGAGKTILAARLTLELLDTRQAGDPVPVIVNVGSWNPRITSLRDWLAVRLVRDHPGLAPSAHPDAGSLAASLIDTGRILPILDGFDEIAIGLHRSAIEQLNIAARVPFVLTSRPGQYASAVAGTKVLTAAAGIELDDLTLADLVDYLPRTARRAANGQPTEVWHAVLTRLRVRPADPACAVLRQSLSTPLMVYLARTIYSDTPDHDPAELLDPDRFTSPAAVVQHLLAAFIPAVYRQRGPSGRQWDPVSVNPVNGIPSCHKAAVGQPRPNAIPCCRADVA